MSCWRTRFSLHHPQPNSILFIRCCCLLLPWGFAKTMSVPCWSRWSIGVSDPSRHWILAASSSHVWAAKSREESLDLSRDNDDRQGSIGKWPTDLNSSSLANRVTPYKPQTITQRKKLFALALKIFSFFCNWHKIWLIDFRLDNMNDNDRKALYAQSFDTNVPRLDVTGITYFVL